MSGAVGVVAKLAFFVLVVIVGVALFRRDSRRALFDRGTMNACAGFVQADIRAVMPWVDAKVDRCEGIPTRAICSVDSSTRKGRRTAAVKDWDCSKRHVTENDHREWVREVTPSSGTTAAAQDREIQAWTGQVKEQFARGVRYVADKMRERQEALGEPDPYPRVVSSPAE